MKKLIVLFILLLPITAFADIAKNPYSNMPDSLSASNSLGPQAHLLNPAFSARYGSMVSYRYFAHRDKSNSNHFAAIDLSSFRFTYARLNSLYSLKEEEVINTGTNFYNLSTGFFLADIFRFGAGYSLATSRDQEFDRYRSLSFGLLAYTSSFLYFGMTINDAFAKMGGEDLKHKERYSIALRTFSSRLILTTDMIHTYKEAFKHSKWEFTASLLFENINMYAKITPDKTFSFGATIAFSLDNKSSSSLRLDGQTSGGGTEIPAGYHSVAASMTIYRDTKRTSSNRQNRAQTENKNLNVRYNLSKLLQKYEEKEITGSKPLTFSNLTFQLKQAVNDSSINIIVLNLNGSQITSNEALQLREIIQDLRTNNKTIFAEITNPGQYDYFVAASADKIYYNSDRDFSLFAKAPKSNLSDEFITTIMNDRNISKETMELLVEKWNISSAEAKELDFIDDTERIEKYYPITIIGDAKEKQNLKESCIDFLDNISDEVADACLGNACSQACGRCCGNYLFN